MDLSPALKVEEIRAVPSLVVHENAWRALHGRSLQRDVFNSHEWLSAWLSAHWHDGPISFRLAWSGADLVGLVPLLDDAEGRLGCPGAFVSPVDAQVTRLAPLLDDRVPGALQALLEKPRADEHARPIIFKRLPVVDGGADALRAAAASVGLLAHQLPGPSSPVVDLSDGLDGFWAGRSKHFRRESRRKRRMASITGSARLHVISEAGRVAQAMSVVMEIERASWKEAQGSSLTSEPGSRDLYASLAESLATDGTLRLFILELHGRPSAHAFCSRIGDTLFALKTSYRVDDAKLSPGAVLFGHIVQYAAESGCRTLELLGTTDEWKRRMATGSAEVLTLCLFPSNSLRCHACRLVEGTVKPFMRDRLPGTVTSLKRARSLVARDRDGSESP